MTGTSVIEFSHPPCISRGWENSMTLSLVPVMWLWAP